MDKKPVTVTISNAIFHGGFEDEHARGSVKSSGDLSITVDADTLDAISEFLLSVIREEEANHDN